MILARIFSYLRKKSWRCPKPVGQKRGKEANKLHYGLVIMGYSSPVLRKVKRSPLFDWVVAGDGNVRPGTLLKERGKIHLFYG